MSIESYILRRLLHALPLLLCVIVFNFILIHLAPGDPIQSLVGEFPVPEAYKVEMGKHTVSISLFMFNCCYTSATFSPAILVIPFTTDNPFYL
jgi:ABC-type dipeptide/oligopeptide/nickel transport system permease component